MKSIFEYSSYKSYFNDRLKTLPKNGHGEFRRVAHHLKIHTSLVSHVFRGSKDLTFEQGCALCEYLALNSLETEYFLLLIQREKAGTKLARNIIEQKIEKIKIESNKVSNRISHEKKLDESAQGTFYSNWYYSAVRLMTALEGQTGPKMISDELNLSLLTVLKVIEFLLSHGLIISEKNRLSIGPKSTHVDSDSPYSVSHHRNWRLKTLERSGVLTADELMFTSPMMISKKDQLTIRTETLKFIEKVSKIAEPSSSERLVCLNIDLVGVNNSALK